MGRPRGLVIAAVVLLGIAALVAISRMRTTDEAPVAPEVTVAFPDSVEAGSVHTATFTIRNPGPRDLSVLFVSFSLVGVPGAEDQPNPLVQGAGKGASSVVEVRPVPTAVGGGVRFAFGSLAAGESTTVEFDLRAPDGPGPAANSVLVYDGRDPEVAAGVKLATTVDA